MKGAVAPTEVITSDRRGSFPAPPGQVGKFLAESGKNPEFRETGRLLYAGRRGRRAALTRGVGIPLCPVEENRPQVGINPAGTEGRSRRLLVRGRAWFLLAQWLARDFLARDFLARDFLARALLARFRLGCLVLRRLRLGGGCVFAVAVRRGWRRVRRKPAGCPSTGKARGRG